MKLKRNTTRYTSTCCTHNSFVWLIHICVTCWHPLLLQRMWRHSLKLRSRSPSSVACQHNASMYVQRTSRRYSFVQLAWCIDVFHMWFSVISAHMVRSTHWVSVWGNKLWISFQLHIWIYNLKSLNNEQLFFFALLCFGSLKLCWFLVLNLWIFLV